MNRHAATLVAILLLGFGLRVAALDLRALWWDEGLSYLFSQLGYFENAVMAARLADTNPPMYRLLLGGWLAVFGESAFSARLLSALAGTALLMVIYAVAAQLDFQPDGRLAAVALAAVSPILIFYAQEAKGYSVEALAGVSAVAVWLRLHGWLWQPNSAPPHPLWWAVWGVALLFSIGVHYIAAFLILALNAWTVALLFSRYGPRWPRAAWRHVLIQLGVQAVVAAVLLPYVWMTFGATRAIVAGETTQEFAVWAGPLAFLAEHALQFASGPQASWWPGGLALIALVGLIAWGLARSERIDRHGLLLSWVLLPLGLGLALSAFHSFFFPRFLLYCVPAVLLLAALGWQISPRWLQGVAVAVLLVAWLPTLAGFYTRWDDPAEDWRPVAAAVAEHVREEDGAVYVWGWMPGYLQAYMPNAPQPDYYLGFFTPDTVASSMAEITAKHARVWLLDYQIDALDERNLAGRWLKDDYGMAYAVWVGNSHLSLWVTALPETADLTSVAFENGLTLHYAPISGGARPGDALGVRLHWETPAESLPLGRVFLHLIAPDGVLAVGRDGDLQNGSLPLSLIAPHTTVDEVRAAMIPNVPPEHCGFYTLLVGVYDPVTGERWLLSDGRDAVEIGTVVMLADFLVSP